MPNLKHLTWMLAVRGLAALLFGVLAMSLPKIVLLTFLYLFAFYAIVDGVAMLVGAATSSQHHDDWWLMLLAGILSAAIGIITVLHTEDMKIVLAIFIAARALVIGVLEIAFAFGLRRRGASWLLVLLSGVISVMFGLAVFAAPLAGVLAIVWVIGAFSIAYAVTQLVLASEVRHWGKTHTPTP